MLHPQCGCSPRLHPHYDGGRWGGHDLHGAGRWDVWRLRAGRLQQFLSGSHRPPSWRPAGLVTEGFHSATLLPLGEDPDAWFADNASDVGEPFFILQSDPDDGVNGYKYNNAAIFGTETTCGTDSACVFDGSGVVSSNVLGSDPFLTRLDVPAGSHVWVVCLIHHEMRMEIDVVDDASAVQTQADIDTDRDVRLAQEGAEAQALHDQMLDEHSSHTENGRKVWDITVGVDTETFSLYGFYPEVQTVRRGQGVEFHFEQLTLEDHTASIDRKRTKRRIIQRDFQLMCDPDGDAGRGPDEPPELEDPPFCVDPLQVEIDAAPKAVVGAGNGEYLGGGDFESSPVTGPNSGVQGNFQVVFPKDLNKTVRYICVLHPNIKGKIVM